MAIDAVSSTTTAADRTGATAKNTLSRQDFLNIMLSEMTHQDPMNPVDNQQFLSQLSQLESLQAMNSLSDNIASMLAVQQLGSASALIGKTVEGKGANGEALAGVVEKVVIQNGAVSVVVGGTQLPFANVQSVQG